MAFSGQFNSVNGGAEAHVCANLAWRRFLKELAEHLTTSNVESVKFLCKGILPDGRTSSVKDGLGLFKVLEENGIIDSSKLDDLKAILSCIPRMDLLKFVNVFEASSKPLHVPLSNGGSYLSPSHLPVERTSSGGGKRSPSHLPVERTGSGGGKRSPSHLPVERTSSGRGILFPSHLPVERTNSVNKVQSMTLLGPDYFTKSKSKSQVKAVTSEEKPLGSPVDEVSRLITDRISLNEPERSESPKITNPKPSSLGGANKIPVASSKAKPSRENRETDAGVNRYDMTKSPRGKCLIISNRYFVLNETRTTDGSGDILDDRHGTEIDAEALKKLFEWLKYEVEVIQNCTTDTMLEAIAKFSKIDHTEYNSFVCCLMSHGFHGGIYGTDGKPLFINDIRTSFSGDICYSLHGKPKLFFIQACRGTLEDPGQCVISDGLSGLNLSADTPGCSILPNDSDFLFANATTPGRLSWRSKSEGSWFISILCKVFREAAHKLDLISLLTVVNSRLAEKKFVFPEGRVKQSAEKTDNLRKNLFFNPDLSWQEYELQSKVKET